MRQPWGAYDAIHCGNKQLCTLIFLAASMKREGLLPKSQPYSRTTLRIMTILFTPWSLKPAFLSGSRLALGCILDAMELELCLSRGCQPARLLQYRRLPPTSATGPRPRAAGHRTAHAGPVRPGQVWDSLLPPVKASVWPGSVLSALGYP